MRQDLADAQGIRIGNSAVQDAWDMAVVYRVDGRGSLRL